MKNETLWKLLATEILITVFIFGGIIILYGTSSTAANWVQSILTACAICVAIGVPLWTRHNDLEDKYHVAEVIVATALRKWLRITSAQIAENIKHSINGDHGWVKTDIPSINVPYDQIAIIRPLYAKRILDLMERCERRRDDIAEMSSKSRVEKFNNPACPAKLYYEEIPHIFWSVRRIYIEIAKARGLTEYTNRPEEIAAVKMAEDYAKQNAPA